MPESLPSPDFWASLFVEKDRPSKDASKERWDEKAPSFARKKTRSGYISQLIERLSLAPDESVFDMGCGPGTLAIPLAQSGHSVIAVDFSPAMLDQLHDQATAAGPGIAARIAAYERSWSDPWDGLPQADVSVASRSLITNDLAASLSKLESQARRRVVVTVVAGETPMGDLRLLKALGRPAQESALRTSLIAVVNYLFAIGRRPKVDYLSFVRQWHADSVDALRALLAETVAPLTSSEDKALDAFVTQHATFDSARGQFALNYEQQSSWAYLEWDVPSA